MRIAFVQNFWYEYLGVMSISAVVKQHGHETRVFISGAEHDLLASVENFQPDVIAFPTYSGSQGWVIQTARLMKKKLKKLIVLGGPHATFFPDIIKKPGIDIVCRGEGEYAMLELLDALEQKKSYRRIRNLWIKVGKKIIKNPIRNLIDPLDTLPYLDRAMYYRYPYLRDNSVKNFSIGRGCPFRCAYCHNSGLAALYKDKGMYVRRYSIKRAIEEIVRVKKQYRLKRVCFVDDTFSLNKPWLFEFLSQYKKKVGVPFVANIRAGLVDDQLARKMRASGCISVFMGVESGDEKLRLRVLKKSVTNASLIATSQVLHKHHINIAANNMIGLPGETIAHSIETIRFNALIKTDLPWCSIFQPYPGTELADYSVQMGLVSKKDLESIGESFHRTSVLKNKDIKLMINLHKLFHLGVWFPQLIPFLLFLARLPLTRAYDFIFLINQGSTYMRFFALSPIDFIPHATHFARFYFGRQRSAV